MWKSFENFHSCSCFSSSFATPTYILIHSNLHIIKYRKIKRRKIATTKCLQKYSMQISKLIYSKLCAKRNQNKKHTHSHTPKKYGQIYGKSWKIIKVKEANKERKCTRQKRWSKRTKKKLKCQKVFGRWIRK